MPRIRLERIPIRTFGLGVLGFDHLQLVYQPDPADSGRNQETWFVIEGLREPAGADIRLAVEGWEGGTTLAEANGGAYGDELAARIGTPETRGSRAVPLEPGSEINAWGTIVAHAADIEAQHLPYIAFSLPGSAIPTINSASLIASLLYYAGVDIASLMPFGVRLAPGTQTLIGSAMDDELRIGAGFTTLIGGIGNDTLWGSNAAGQIDKLYGGAGDDRFHWSKGTNIIHGGQPGLGYAADGTDTVDYSGVGEITIEANGQPVEHERADFVATFDGGRDYLFSIERILWDPAHDHIILGKGVVLAEDTVIP